VFGVGIIQVFGCFWGMWWVCNGHVIAIVGICGIFWVLDVFGVILQYFRRFWGGFAVF